MRSPSHRSRFCWPLLLPVLCAGLAAGCAEEGVVTPPPPPPPPATAELLLTIVTVGSQPDPDGYTVTLDDVSTTRVAASAESLLTVTPGPHTLRLGDLAANCSTNGNDTVGFSVSKGGKTAVAFVISCPGIGILDITTATSGVTLDPDGYILSIDGVVRDTLAVQDAFHLEPLPPSVYTVRLSSVAGNCSVSGGSTRSVNLGDGEAVRVEFVVTCVLRPDDTPGEKLVVSSRDGNTDSNLELMETNGSGRQAITDDLGDEMVPEFSLDGERILFIKSSGNVQSLAVMQRTSRQVTILPTTGVERAVWSPDRARIAFTRAGRIRLMNADGSGEIALTAGGLFAHDPYWSPDGTQIAFTGGYTVDSRIHLINVDGSNDRIVGASDRMAGPWSPDGRKLIVTKLECVDYYYGCYYGPSPSDFAVLTIATGAEQVLTDSPLQPEWSPAWSRDGQGVYYISFAAGNQDVFVVPVGGGAPVNVTHSFKREEWVSLGTVAPSAAPAVLRLPRRP
jgi:Tol biopolymer transport system component